MGFWGGMFGGKNDTLNSGKKQTGQVAGFGIDKGEGLTSLAGDWMSSLLGGDTAKISKLLAPQIDTIQKQGQQEKKTMSEFGNRSGGMNAKAQTIDDTTRGSVNNMISSLTGNAVGGAASLGQGLLETGMKSLGMQVDMSQQQMQNWNDSLFGKALAKLTS